MVLGTRKEEIGKVVLYKSKDLRDWEYRGVLAESDGTLGYMWECPDFFELGGKHVLLFSPQGIEAQGESYKNLFQTGYLIGSYDYEKNEFVHETFTELDYGHDFYAVQTFLDDKQRRIAIGWMDMWESNMPTKEDGWAGALTLPRELTLGEDGKLRMNPVEELALLRQSETLLCEEQIVSGRSLKEVKEDLMELQADFDLSKTDAGSVGVAVRGENGEAVSITYLIKEQKLILDCSHIGKEADGIRTTSLEASGRLSLRVFLDRSSIEVFANEGQATMSSRIYPKEERLGIELFAEDGQAHVSSLTSWTLKDIWK